MGARPNHKRAFDDLARRYRPGVYALCLDRTRDFDVAEDLTQEALLKAHAAVSSLRDPEAFPQWLRQIALNCCRSWVRRRMPAHTDLTSAELVRGPGTFEEVARRQLAREIASALAQLPENSRLAFLMHVQGCRYREIAEFLGVAETTVVGRLHRARGRIRRVLQARIAEHLSDLGL